MNKFLEIGLIIIAVTAVAGADVLIKKIAFGASNFIGALKNPWMLPVVALYLVQILIFLCVFVKKAELGTVGILQTALYAIIVITSGILFFGEKISPVQAVGMAFAILGVAMINI